MRLQIRKLVIVAALLAPAMPTLAQSDYEKFSQQRKSGFETYKKTLEEQFAEFKAIYREETEKYQQEVSAEWADPELSTQTTWVEYSNDLTERTKVNFEDETITIEITDAKTADVSEKVLREMLTELVTRNQAEAFAADVVAQAVEHRSIAEIEDLRTAEVEPQPILLPYLTGMYETGAAMVTEIVTYMVDQAKITLEPGKDGNMVQRIEVPLTVPEKIVKAPRNDMIPEQMPRQARSFWAYVDNFATVAGMERALVYAVIETESAFNPLAKSNIPAYGLMQIVPESAGKDATKQLLGESMVLSPSYLYNAGKNIEIGATYLNILYYRYLKKIDDPLSRLYCSIAAYNTGPGNVAKTFTGKMRIQPAIEIINSMPPEQVYSTLIENLPYAETRQYLKKVSTRMEKYSAMGI